MNRIKVKNNQIGAASIIMTMIMLTGMLFVALAVNSIVQNGILMSRAHLNSTKAYFAAESGTERILWRIRKSESEAYNPTNETPAWVSGSCVRLNDPLNSCSLDCDGSDPHLYKTFDSPNEKSKYKIKYEYNATSSVATFSTTGIYDDITKRVVEVKYQF